MSQNNNAPSYHITSGRSFRPAIVLAYGSPGIGKTHFASQFSERTLVCDFEEGSDFLDVQRIKIKSFPHAIQFMSWFAEHPDYDAVVFDSLTAFERIASSYTVKANGWVTIEDVGYGKGWSTYRGYMEKIFQCWEHIRNSGKSVILVGHSQVKTVNDPTQATYDRVEYNIDAKLQPVLTSILDACFYLRPQLNTMEEKNRKRTFNNGTRELITVDRGGSLSKNRFTHLPEVIEFPSGKNDEEINRMYRDFWKQLRNVGNNK